MHEAPRSFSYLGSGKRWEPGDFKRSGNYQVGEPLTDEDKEWERRKAAGEFIRKPMRSSLSDEDRQHSRQRVADKQYEAHEAEHWAGKPYASPEQMANAERLRHEANLAHVEHADKFSPEEAHDASQEGHEMFLNHLVALDEAQRESKFSEASPHIFFKGPKYTVAQPKMFFDPEKEGPKFSEWRMTRQDQPNPKPSSKYKVAEPKMFFDPAIGPKKQPWGLPPYSGD